VPTATLTSKGQITLPQAVRRTLGLHAGIKVDFVAVPGGFKIVPLLKQATGLKGRFAGRNSKPVGIEEMDEAIATEASARHVRGKK